MQNRETGKRLDQAPDHIGHIGRVICGVVLALQSIGFLWLGVDRATRDGWTPALLLTISVLCGLPALVAWGAFRKARWRTTAFDVWMSIFALLLAISFFRLDVELATTLLVLVVFLVKVFTFRFLIRGPSN